MARYLTYTTYADEDPQALSEAEFAEQGTLDDWAEYVWQEAPDKATAIAQHAAKMDAYEADHVAGRPIKHTY